MDVGVLSEKAQKKLEKASETRVLDPWERYRAPGDLLLTYGIVS